MDIVRVTCYLTFPLTSKICHLSPILLPTKTTRCIDKANSIFVCCVRELVNLVLTNGESDIPMLVAGRWEKGRFPWWRHLWDDLRGVLCGELSACGGWEEQLAYRPQLRSIVARLSSTWGPGDPGRTRCCWRWRTLHHPTRAALNWNLTPHQQ